MRLLQAAAESRIPAAPAAQLLQAVHTAAIQRLISAASRRHSLFAGRLKDPIASTAQRMYMTAQNAAQTRQRPVGLRQPSAAGKLESS